MPVAPPMPVAPELPKPAAPEFPQPPPGGGVDPTGALLGRAAGTARVGTARVPAAPARVPVEPPDIENLWETPSRRDTRPGRGAPAAPARDEPARGAKQQRRPETAPAPTGARHSRRWMVTLTAVGLAVVLTVCGLAGYFMINNEGGKGDAPQAGNTAAATKPRDISTRDVDPAPLSEQEVFPAPQVTVGGSAYPVLKTQAGDCQSAATDELAKLLGAGGCSQVVRATLKSPDGQFLMTMGVFNLKDDASATQASDSIKGTIDGQKGRFTGLVAGDATEAIVRAPTTLGWQPRGHFLAYCIVARADSKPIPADDEASKRIISDLVERHLRDSVIAARAVVSTSATPKPGG